MEGHVLLATVNTNAERVEAFERNEFSHEKHESASSPAKSVPEDLAIVPNHKICTKHKCNDHAISVLFAGGGGGAAFPNPPGFELLDGGGGGGRLPPTGV